MFCDELDIKIIAGNGGNGCTSFRREKYVPKGGPDGGDGGNGGNVIIRTNSNLNTLSHLTNGKIYNADSGNAGRKKNMSGKTGEDLIIEVPVGTIIFNKDKSEVLADLDNLGEQILMAKGGKGGMGNAHFVSSVHQAPKFSEYGEPGEEQELALELKLVADVGLIGLPSVGKSTLISVISNAKPKIAAYHFTTLVPNLGVVNMSKFGGSTNDSFVVADIPGLIEGASEGKGLGHQFLKHTTRTKLLIHIIDPLFGDVEKNYKTINSELKKFSKELAKREQIVVLNKIDLLSEEDTEEKIKEIKKVSKKRKIFPISGVTHEGLQPLLYEIIKQLTKIKEKPADPQKTEIHVLKPHLERVRFEIEKVIQKKDNKIFIIKGKRIEQLIVMTDITNIEGLERIYHFLEKLGIKKAVERKNATFGDILRINGKNIPYRK